MSEDDKRNCCLVEIHETEAKYYKTLEDIEKVSATGGGVCTCLSTCNFLCQNTGILGAGVGNRTVSFCHFIVGGQGRGLTSQHGNVTYWQVLWVAQMSQELIDLVIISQGAPLGVNLPQRTFLLISCLDLNWPPDF